jgi:hypothetical protein
MPIAPRPALPAMRAEAGDEIEGGSIKVTKLEIKH